MGYDDILVKLDKLQEMLMHAERCKTIGENNRIFSEGDSQDLFNQLLEKRGELEAQYVQSVLSATDSYKTQIGTQSQFSEVAVSLESLSKYLNHVVYAFKIANNNNRFYDDRGNGGPEYNRLASLLEFLQKTYMSMTLVEMNKHMPVSNFGGQFR